MKFTTPTNRGLLKKCSAPAPPRLFPRWGELSWDDKVMIINDSKIGPVSAMLYKELTDIQWGRSDDGFGWTTE